MSDVPQAFLEQLSVMKVELDAGELERLSQFIDVLFDANEPVSYTHLTLPTNREV